ncbi:uncharacterized oxidoreductase YjmC-like [Ornithodoros turicata]|uniref:uncharacterized oxidoreductase YjmC-like n=1 Tax=Ornithodoros turicata TaxID=34597 RepID=UPI003138A236
MSYLVVPRALLKSAGSVRRGFSFSTKSRAMAAEGILVEKQEMKSFIIRCMEKVGTEKSHAEALADVLVAGDHRGHFSHGLNRLEMYVNDISRKICEPKGQPTIVSERAGTAMVDGNNVLGPVVGMFCMQLAIKKARETGVGWVVARGSNHFGIAGYYTLMATAQGMLGMSFTNGSPLVVPTGGKKKLLSTNPISVAAPAKNGDEFVLDMATSAVALGKIELQKRKGEPIPKGWAVDPNGKVTTDPEEAMKGALLPLGGPVETSGYKGYGLAMVVELFCGILGGAHYGPNVRNWLNTTDKADLGHCFVAIDPTAFAPGFEDRMQDLMDTARGTEPADENGEVLVAGDPERRHMAKCDAEGGIRYHINQIKFADGLAAKLSVDPVKRKTN